MEIVRLANQPSSPTRWSRDRSPSRAALRQRPGAFRAIDEPRVYRFLSARAEFRQRSSSGPAGFDLRSSVGRTQMFPTLPRARRWEGRRAHARSRGRSRYSSWRARPSRRRRRPRTRPPRLPPRRTVVGPPPARRRGAPSAPSSVGSTRTATDRSRRTSSRRTSGTPWAGRTSTPRGRSARRWWA